MDKHLIERFSFGVGDRFEPNAASLNGGWCVWLAQQAFLAGLAEQILRFPDGAIAFLVSPGLSASSD